MSTSRWTLIRPQDPARAALQIGAILISTALLGGCATPRPPAPSVDTSAATPAYVIGAGDVLGIFVYRSPELSADLPVRPDGRVSMPLVPDIQAAGRTPSQLAVSIQEQLRQYVRDPNVTVMVRSFVGPSSSMVRVIGEAAQPIAIPYRDGMTLLDVLIASRGLTRYAAGDRAQIIRHAAAPAAESQIIPVRLAGLLRDGDVAQDIPMRPGDTLVIPRSWF